MSEPAKKPAGQVPEGYQPKAKPEIICMAAQAQNDEGGAQQGPSFKIDVFPLERPLYAVGRAARVTHGTPECFPAIDALIQGFDADDVVSAIPDRASPVIPFGIGLDHVSHGGDRIEFTYMRAILVREPPAQNRLPEGLLCHTIPAGHYARNRVRAKSIGEALGPAYIELDRWVKASREWESCGGSDYEVFTGSVYNPGEKRFDTPAWPKPYEMEKWERVRMRRNKKKGGYIP